MTSKTIKARAFAFIIYPESWVSWKRDLQHLHMPVVVSPLHDRDCTADGTSKKPHRHAIISWSNPTTLRNALSTLAPFGIEHVEAVGSYQGYCRYLIHLDNPEKAQYDAADIVSLNGAVVDLTRKLTNSEIIELRNEITGFCHDNAITEYADLIELAKTHRPDWLWDIYYHATFWAVFFASVRGGTARNNPPE